MSKFATAGAAFRVRVYGYSNTAVANDVLRRLGDVERYWRFLEVIARRFEQASSRYLTRRVEFNALLDTMRRKAGTPAGQGRVLTPEENAVQDEIRRLIDDVHLEIEAFYVFAKILLDRLAELFRMLLTLPPFRQRGSAHAQLATRIGKRTLKIDLGRLGAKIEDLTTRVVNFRSENVEHVPDLHRRRVTVSTPSDVKILVGPPDGAGAVQSEDPRALLRDIDQYCEEVFQFVEAHLDKTILR